MCITSRYIPDLSYPTDNELLLEQKIKVSNIVFYTIESQHYTTYSSELASELLHKVIGIYFPYGFIISILQILFISDLKNMTKQRYLELPKSMSEWKLISKLHESSSQDFEYNWVPHSFSRFVN